MEKLLFKIIKKFITKDRLKDIVFALLDAAANEVVNETPDEIGNMSLDDAVIVLKNNVKRLIDRL